MSAYDSPMTVGKMPNGQPCIRLPRGLVATMEAGSDATREADAAEVARRWNAAPDLLDFVRRVVSDAGATVRKGANGMPELCGGLDPAILLDEFLRHGRKAIARATGGDK